METGTWYTSKDVMEQCKINAVTLSKHILDKHLPIYSISDLSRNTVHLSILIRFSKSTRSLQGTVLGRR